MASIKSRQTASLSHKNLRCTRMCLEFIAQALWKSNICSGRNRSSRFGPHLELDCIRVNAVLIQTLVTFPYFRCRVFPCFNDDCITSIRNWNCPAIRANNDHSNALHRLKQKFITPRFKVKRQLVFSPVCDFNRLRMFHSAILICFSHGTKSFKPACQSLMSRVCSTPGPLPQSHHRSCLPSGRSP